MLLRSKLAFSLGKTLFSAKFKWFEENFLCLKPDCIAKKLLIVLFSNNLCIQYTQSEKKSYVRKCAFSLISVWRTVFYLSFVIILTGLQVISGQVI